MAKPTFVIDFDSTFTKVEALDILADIIANENPELAHIRKEIAAITNLAMDGVLSFQESLESRLNLLHANKSHLKKLVEELKTQISPSFNRNKEFLESNRDNIYIVSNGFTDFICPIIEHMNLDPNKVYANKFQYNLNGDVIGFDHDNLLAQDGGKPKVIAALEVPGEIYVIGDGYNDFEIHAKGLSKRFFAFTENVSRQNVIAQADDISPNLDDVLFELDMPRSHSFPKNRIKVLLLEGVHPNAVKLFEEEGYAVDYLDTALHEDELCQRIKDISLLGIRSKTQVTKKVIQSANRLIAIGAYCIGTNQIDLKAAAKHGVAVFNAPYSNTRSVVELALAQMILLIRNLPDKMRAMHNGKWEKSAINSKEIRGKKIGIVGYGNIGTQLSVLAEAVGMDVYYYDIVEKMPLGNATKCHSLEELFSIVDVISLHVDGRKENNSFVDAKCFSKMKDGVIFLNLSRGKVVDVNALANAVNSGKVGGCSVDVFPIEPKSNNDAFQSPLQGLPNTILTPHIGGSTEEAQQNIGAFVPKKIIHYVNTGSTDGSVNLPNVQLPVLQNAHRLLHIHRNEPNVLAQINKIMGEHGINVLGQYLKTNENIGYLITDIDKAYEKELVKELKQISATIWLRVLY